MYLTPSYVFNLSCLPDAEWRKYGSCLEYAESLSFKPPIEALGRERFGIALWSYKSRPWHDECSNAFFPDGTGPNQVIGDITDYFKAIYAAYTIKAEYRYDQDN